METLDAIRTRRSIRRYTSESIPEQAMTETLRAAMMAPSAGNAQPWQFVVITDRAMLDAIPDFHPYSAMLKQVSVAVLVCGDLSLEKYPGYWIIDCAAATQNLLLAAHALGLGTVWLGIYPEKERVEGMRRLLNLPERIVPHSLIPIGYASEQKEHPDRFQKSRIHRNGW
jgi:nitroreductase